MTKHRLIRKDSARTELFAWGAVLWLIEGGEESGEPGMTTAIMEVLPGQASARHRHQTCNEALFVLEGRITVLLGNESVWLRPGESLFIPAGAIHHCVNETPEPARLFVTYSSDARDYQAV